MSTEKGIHLHGIWSPFGLFLGIFLVLGWIPAIANGALAKYKCDALKNEAVIQPSAQAFLVGLFSFHQKGGMSNGCGESRPASMQAYEAIRWALDLVNKKGEKINGEFLKDFYVPGIRIGMLARDYCDQQSLATAALQDAINEIESTNCASQIPPNNPKLLLGVIGASTDDATLAIAEYSTTHRLPLISYISTTHKLSDNQKYPYVMRTVPSDKSLLGVLVEVLQKLNWNFVTVVYTDDIGGMDSFMELRERVTGKGICLTTGVAMSSTDTNEATMKKVLAQVKSKGTTGVIYLGTGTVLQSLFKAANNYPDATDLQWVVTSSLSLASTFPNNKYPRGVVAVLTGSRFIVEFEDHWKRINESSPSTENPWFQEWYMNYWKCRLPGVTEAPFSSYPNCVQLSEAEKRRQFVQDQSVEPAVHAVFTYARALRMAQADKCGTTPGMCTALAAMPRTDYIEKYLKKVKFTYQTSERIASLASSLYAPYKKAKDLNFDSNGDVINPEFGIWNFNDYTGPGATGFRFRNVGSYSNGRLNFEMSKVMMYGPNRITKLSPLPSSSCGLPVCYPCLTSYPDRKYLYKPGDIVINGFFSIHDSGITPYSCGAFNTIGSQVQLLEAMSFAATDIKTKYPSLLPGVELGIIGLDDCSMSSTALGQISDIQQSQMKIIDPTTGAPLLPLSVSGYVGLAHNELTVPVAGAMNTWKRPLVGYVQAGTKLTQTDKYPYYLSTLPSVSQIMMVLARMLKELDVKYIQVVESDDDYGTVGMAVLLQEAAKFGICLVSCYRVGPHTTGAQIINFLREIPHVKPTIVIMHPKDIHKLMEGVKSMGAVGEFSFIGLETWGTSEKVVEPFRAEANGVLTIKHRTTPLAEFMRYLQSLDLTKDKTNPWLTEWWQSLYHCAFQSVNSAGFSTACNTSVAAYKITNAPTFVLDPQAASVINAVYAFAHGLHATLTEMCGKGYNGVCSEYFTSRFTGKYLVEKIKEATFQDGGGNLFSFNQAGYGNVPYEIYNYYGGKYTKVGSYDVASGSLQLSNSIQLYGGASVSILKSTCPNQCVLCQYLLGFRPFLYIPGDLLLPAVFDIHSMGTSPFVCGDIRLHGGFQNAEAMTFALDWINSGKFGDLKAHNVSLGALGFDGCSTPEQAKALTYNLHNGLFNPKHLDLQNLSPSKIQSWLSYDSGSTIKMSSLLRPRDIMLVSPGATSPALLDKNTHSTFFRTMPSDVQVVQAMARVVKELGFSYIITLNAPDVGSRDALELFRMTIEGMGVCIASSLEFGKDGSPENIVYDITRSSTRVVVVFAEFGQDIENLLIAKQKLPASKNIVFVTNRAWYLPPSLSNAVIEKSIMFQKEFPIINEFKQWLTKKTPANRDKTNPWFDEYFEKVYGCSMGVNCQKTQSVVDSRFVQDATVVPTVDAVFAVAIALQKTLEEKCGPTYMGVCSKFLSDVDTKKRLMAHMDAVQMKTIYNDDFEFINRERSVKIMVKRISNGAVDYIAGYANNTLTYYTNQEAIVRDYDRVPSKCLAVCSKCEGKKKNTEEFIFNPGDFLLVGLFDVHKKGATPFTCGPINNKQGFQLVEAFNYAINYVNSQQGIFGQIMRGVTLGSLSLDVCQSPLRAANLVSNLHSQTVHLFGNATNKINPEDFQVYIGPLNSDSSVRVADVLNKLGVPQISYGATSVELRNEKYPFFLRTVPADDKQARAMIAYLKSFSITHVQVLYSNDTVGRHGREEFAKLAFVNRICIVQNISLARDGALTQQEAVEGVNKLLSYPKSNAVIVFVTNPRLILLAAEKNKKIAGEYLFLVTDKWGYDTDMLNGLDDLLKYRHVVIFDIETADLPGFDRYLDKKTPISNVNNPWFDEYYQLMYDCSLGAPTSQYSKKCTGTNYKTIPRANSYVQDPYVLYVVNAVFSAAIGIHKTLQNVCGINYRGICLDYLNGGDQKQEILQGIKEARFEDATQQPFFFVHNTFESDRGYHIYEPILESTVGINRYRYENVGSYNDTHYLKIDARYRQTWRTSCPEAMCPKCEFPPYHPSRFMAQKSPFYLNIVAVMSIHRMDSTDPEKCGPLDWASNFQNLLAFFYAIDNVNKNDLFKLSNSLQLGGVAIDTCSNPARIGQDIYSLLSGEGLCGAGGNDKMIIPPATIVAFLPKSSANAIPVAEIVSPYNLTTLSQSATSAKLSNKDIYPYFLRTVPPDNIQALVMANILNKMQWTYVSCVYSDDAYGQAGYAEFLRESQNKETGFCLAQANAMSMGSGIDEARTIIQQLNQKAGARAVVLFVSSYQIRLLLQAAKDLKLTRRFVWLGSDTWANSHYVVGDGLEDVAAGAITVQIRSMAIEGYRKYVRSLTLANHAPIPDDWFDEFYQDIHNCRILRSVVQKNYNRLCTGNEKMTDSMLPTDPYIFQTILAVDMIALGLNNIKKCRKNNALTVAACLALQPERNQLIYKSILKSQWNQLHKDGVGIPDNFRFRFTDDGFGDIGYDILNYRYNLTSNKYEYEKIGYWVNELSLTMSKYRGVGTGETFVFPRSYCTVGGTCNCLNADGKSVEYKQSGQASPLISGGQEILIDPETGVVVDLKNRPTAYNRFSQIGGTIITTLAALGTFFAICLFCYFLIFFPFRGSTTILGFTLLFAIIFLYLLAIAFVAHATPVVCSIRRFFLGFFYSLAYSALFIKLLDAYRNKKKEELVYKKLSRPCGLLMSCLLLVGVQSIINIEWLILIPPEVVSIPYEGVMWPRCAPSATSDEALVMSLVFVMCILALCLLFGLCTWSSKNNGYEARWIFGMALLSILVWIIWCLVSIVSSYSTRDIAVAVGLLINASILLVLGPIRRLRLLKEYKQKKKPENSDYYLYDSDLNNSLDYSQAYNAAPQLRMPDDVHY